MSDQETTLAQAKQWVDHFVSQRSWRQFHTPKNLSMSLAIEAAELMEHFQWLSAEESQAVANRPEKLAEVGEELADVFSYGLALANQLGIDLSDTLQKKLVKNAQKYPVSQYRGRFGPDDPHPVEPKQE